MRNGTASRLEKAEKKTTMRGPLTFVLLIFRTHAYAKPAPMPPMNPARDGSVAEKSKEGFTTSIDPPRAPQIARNGTRSIFSPRRKKLNMRAKNGDILLRIDASAMLILSSA